MPSVNHLAKRLENVGIIVNYMATVDAANGWGSSKVDRSIGSNVLWNDNYYEINLSLKDPTFSHGGPNKGSSPNIHNYPVYQYNHMSIDEGTSERIIRKMNEILMQ